MTPPWYDGYSLPNILINDNVVSDNEESDNHDYENVDLTVDETDDFDDDHRI